MVQNSQSLSLIITFIQAMSRDAKNIFQGMPKKIERIMYSNEDVLFVFFLLSTVCFVSRIGIYVE